MELFLIFLPNCFPFLLLFFLVQLEVMVFVVRVRKWGWNLVTFSVFVLVFLVAFEMEI